MRANEQWFCDRIIAKDFSNPAVHITMNDLEDLIMSDELKEELLEKLQQFLESCKNG